MKETTRWIAEADGLPEALALGGSDAGEAELTDTFVDGVRAWAHEHVDPLAIDARGHLGAPLLRQAAELGLFGLSLPEAFGGAGLSMTAAGRVVAELAVVDRSLATCVGLHNGLGSRGLIARGSAAQQARYLPDMASGRRLGAFAATEPNAGSHIAGIRTKGLLTPADTLTVNGAKIYVTNGALADVFTVVARTPGLGGKKNGWSLLALEGGDPGLQVGREEHKLGIRASSTTTLDLDDVEIGLDRVIGEPADGVEGFHEVLSWGRALMAAGCVGTARGAYERAREHTALRKQFGRTLDAFPVVRETLVDMRATQLAMESVVRFVGWLSTRAGTISVPSAAAKVFCSEGAWRVADDAVQLHGGAGFIEETGAALPLRDARITRIFEGANDVLRVMLGAAMLAAPAPGIRLEGQVGSSLAGLAATHDRLAAQAEGVCEVLRTREGVRLWQRQRVLHRLGDVLVHLLTMAATVLRAEGDVRRGAAEADAVVGLATYAVGRLSARVVAGLEDVDRRDVETLVERLSADLSGRT